MSKKKKKREIERVSVQCNECFGEWKAIKGHVPKHCPLAGCGGKDCVGLSPKLYTVTLHGVANVTAKVEVEARTVKEAMKKAKEEHLNGDVWDWEWDGDDAAVDQLYTDESFVEEV